MLTETTAQFTGENIFKNKESSAKPILDNFRQNNSILEFNDHFILSIFRLAADYSLIIEDSNAIVLSSKNFNDLNKNPSNTQKPFKEYKISTDSGLREAFIKNM